MEGGRGLLDSYPVGDPVHARDGHAHDIGDKCQDEPKYADEHEHPLEHSESSRKYNAGSALFRLS
jgi:hypothetical protein